MAKSQSNFGFVECADLITEQHYGRALKFFQLAVSRFLESKSTPKRTEIARQLLHIGAVLEETLKKAYGDNPPHLVLSPLHRRHSSIRVPRPQIAEFAAPS